MGDYWAVNFISRGLTIAGGVGMAVGGVASVGAVFQSLSHTGTTTQTAVWLTYAVIVIGIGLIGAGVLAVASGQLLRIALDALGVLRSIEKKL